ncbi:MAG: hypothetical protein ABR577_00025 [Pyrinomonadaceae bacterium]
MPDPQTQIETLLRDLPDTEGARLFFARLEAEQPRAATKLARDPALFSDTLALAAWSPLLATTLAQHPEYLQWLAREKGHARVRTREEFGESFARFAATHSQLDAHTLLARFRRRELLRIYLRDIRRTATLVEVTEELSNLADAVLEYALSHARQELDNRYGAPLRLDERGRKMQAHLCIIALGKLGSFELNYASDIDLLFLYSDDGTTSGAGTHDAATNREYFIKLAERIARLVGQPAGEGAAYRVDLRLRPHGRDGSLASSLDEAVRYYRGTAQAWELQALIRARAAAGSAELYVRFAESLQPKIYRTDETIARALGNVRLAKQKIDRHHAQDAGGFNVKLGRGGIREIEFIAQALQLAFGGRDAWLRAPHTLISLERLADRRLITRRERAQLFAAYDFLRTLEHRLQMEHGLQTHTLPEDPARRALIARRMNFTGNDALELFNHALGTHTTNVRAAYARVFKDHQLPATSEAHRDETDAVKISMDDARSASPFEETHTDAQRQIDAETSAVNFAASVFAPLLAAANNKPNDQSIDSMFEELTLQLRTAARGFPNASHALTVIARVAASLEKFVDQRKLPRGIFETLIRLCGASEYFGEMLASNPQLVFALPAPDSLRIEHDARQLLFAAVENENSFGAELSALRRAWSSLLLEIGTLDAANEITMREANRRQTKLAAASLDAGCLIARRELERRYGALDAPPRLAVLGLGRLGGGGIDYGSDLDVVLVYDDAAPVPLAGLSHAEAYARFGELLVAALSSMTREGFLYRVDLRLRPDGRNGPTCTSAAAFNTYLATRAQAWEWLAYVKLRAAAGDMGFGEQVEPQARRIVHEAARNISSDSLRTETRRVRERLEQEKRAGRNSRDVDIKFGAGGMLDVYFATRYLQLRDDVPDAAGADRSTITTLERLHAVNSLSDEDHHALSDAYTHLRSLDHALRLVVGRSTRLPAADHPSLREISTRMNHSSPTVLLQITIEHMTHIRAAYERITAQ